MQPLPYLRLAFQALTPNPFRSDSLGTRLIFVGSPSAHFSSSTSGNELYAARRTRGEATNDLANNN